MPFVLPVHADTTDYVARAAVVEGYNTNTYQAQDDPNVPVLRRHPSPFTGVDGDVEMRVTGKKTLQILRIGGRANHYTPLKSEYQSDDGALNGAYSARYELSPRTFATFVADGQLTTLNGSHIADTTIFAFDPTLVRRTYWLSSFEGSLTYEIAKTWRIRQSVGTLVSGTVSQPPTLLPSGQLTQHRGLDYIQPYAETDLFKDFTERTTGDLLLLYQYAYNVYVLDLTQNPPRNIGPDKLAFITGMLGHTYRFSPELIASTHVGGVLASAPPRDPDQRAVISPAALEEVSYTKPLWSLIATAGYTYGTVNPRLGAGPSLSGSLLVVGTPHPVGDWKNFSMLVSAQANQTSLLTGANQQTKLGLYAADAEFRYALSPFIGLLGGYQIRYATYDVTNGQYIPPFLQHVIFFGVSGYWSTNKDIPALTTFVAPIAPPT